ncbi:MAG: aminoacyl-tRNA hydrolase [Clostridia bacterium]|nr:aminoacyl-tRNA hydrolase [Clostridia bacterium]
MKIVFGLGNPDKKYLTTYHNLGFIVADKLAAELGLNFRLKSLLRCTMAKGVYRGEQVIIVKPTIYMNLSGECVKAVKNYFNVDNKDIVVVYDDLDIDIGLIKYRPRGNSGTHNGMRNITACLKTEDFARVRVGTKRENPLIPVVDYVLSNIPESQYPSFNESTTRAKECVLDFIQGKTHDDLMQKYNGQKG